MTLQASPGSDGVEFVTLEDFFVADPSAVYEQIIPPHSPHAANNQNENAQNGKHFLATPFVHVLKMRYNSTF